MAVVLQKVIPLDGAMAAAYAMKQVRPDVVAAYPITPQTKVVEQFSEYVVDGEVDTQFVTVESEHSAMSACIGASVAGARALTATSGPGLALMWELLYVAASLRAPIVMHVVNRALSAPLNIHCDHSDSMGARDAGWIQIYAEDPQEVYDDTLQAVRIAEHKDVLLPVMVMQDGFIVSHSFEPVKVLQDEDVSDFVGEYTPEHRLFDFEAPITFGPWATWAHYFEHKRQQAEAMEHARSAISAMAKEYQSISGRGFAHMEGYRMEGAEIAIMALGSVNGTVRVTVDQMRKEGMKVGALKVRTFRPFPAAELAAALREVKVVGVMDRSMSFGALGGPLFMEVRSALYDVKESVTVVNFIHGLGGRNLSVDEGIGMARALEQVGKEGGGTSRIVNYLGLREE